LTGNVPQSVRTSVRITENEARGDLLLTQQFVAAFARRNSYTWSGVRTHTPTSFKLHYEKMTAKRRHIVNRLNWGERAVHLTGNKWVAYEGSEPVQK
jgi:hypothetical protein